MLFYNGFLNHFRGFIKVYDGMIIKEDYIMLPGDEIVEKKHQNIKVLTAMQMKQDIAKKDKRKWPPVGPNLFIIDYGSLFDNYKEFKQDPTEENTVSNELSGEVEILNTEQHK